MVELEEATGEEVHAEAHVGQHVEVRIRDGVRATGSITAVDVDAPSITVTLDEALDGGRIVTVTPDDVTIL